MTIKKLTLDEKDMNEAVQMFLKTRGITMPVHSVSKEYSFQREYEVTFEFEVDAAPAPNTPAALPVIDPLTEVMSAEKLAAAIAPTGEPL